MNRQIRVESFIRMFKCIEYVTYANPNLTMETREVAASDFLSQQR